MKCPLCDGEYGVENCCVSSTTVYSEEDREWVSMQGFIERRKCCKQPLGEGYGDVNYFKSKQEADEETKKWEQKIGEWW